MTKKILLSTGLYMVNGTKEISPRPLSDEEIFLFHTPEYIDALRRASKNGFLPSDLLFELGLLDTPVFSDLYVYANLAAGGTVVGAECILQGEIDFVFNPSGGYHHALASAAGGFCYINDVVLACKTFRAKGKRIFCLDLDAHHGNGTQAAFYEDPHVFTVSFHESGATLFPWSGFENEIGEGDGAGYNVNVPLPAHTDDEMFVAAFNEVVPPLITAFKPDVILLEVGMDILSVDPLTHLSMTNNAIADTLPFLCKTGIPMLVLGGGGYNPEHTARGWALAWTILCGNEPDSTLSIGMGGVFLGNTEWGEGLRDRMVYSHGDDKIVIREHIEKTLDIIRRTVFPIHSIKV